MTEPEVFPITYAKVSDFKDWPQPPEYITFLARYVTNRKTKEDELDILPVRFSGASRVVSEAAAMAFWNDQNGRKQAKKERGRKLGLSRRKNTPQMETDDA